MIVKVCGVTTAANAIDVINAGADWIGINFWPQSKRFVETLECAAAIGEAARQRGVKVVGVFVNASNKTVADAHAAASLDVVQLHGDEDEPQRKHAATLAATCQVLRDVPASLTTPLWGDYLLIDAKQHGYGGGGVVGDWQVCTDIARRHPRCFLAGGLNTNNVASAIDAVSPFGVDVASGVESSAGIKSATLVAAFVATAKGNRI